MSATQSYSTAARIAGCLKGIATGDAVGKQTENLSHADVQGWYPHGVRGFESPAGSVIPRYMAAEVNRARRGKHLWRTGETTDDTERTIAVARAIIRERTVLHPAIGREMLRCSKCVHPGVLSLWEFHQAADPARTAIDHDGCGAAIRVAPVGIFYRSDRLPEIVAGAREASISTHGGCRAIAAAAAVAAAVSAAVDGVTPREVLEHAERAAMLAERQCRPSGLPIIANAIRAIHDDLGNSAGLPPAEAAVRWFPSHPLTIVPLAVALATVLNSAQDAILFAANIGGDSDSVASIAGGILGALYPDTVNDEWYQVIERINRHDLMAVAQQLSELRH